MAIYPQALRTDRSRSSSPESSWSERNLRACVTLGYHWQMSTRCGSCLSQTGRPEADIPYRHWVSHSEARKKALSALLLQGNPVGRHSTEGTCSVDALINCWLRRRQALTWL